MKCIEVEKLLPLYVEGDAREREANALRAHLSSCALCSQLAEEFRESQERLHNFGVPEFGAEFYAQVRSAVLTEINSRASNARPSLLSRLRPRFAWRPAVAVSFALLFIFAIGLFALYSSQQRSETKFASLDGMSEFSLDEMKESEASAPRRTAAASRNAIARSARRRLPSKEIEAFAAENVGNANASAQREARQEERSATRQQAIARMEIQTSDPNIRIIWLARKTAE
jgi:hypothetical protein